LDKKGELNIALLSIHSCPYAVLGGKDTGGMNVYIRESCRELLGHGHHIDIYTASHACCHCNLIEPGADLKLIHLDNNLSAHSTVAALKKQASALASEIDSTRQTLGYNYDIIQSHYWQSGLVALELQKQWGVPHIAMFHTLGKLKKMFNVAGNDPLARPEIEEEVIYSADRIIASTLREKIYLQQLYGADPGKISVIPCGVNPGIFRPYNKQDCRRELGLDPAENVILFVGRLEPLKGIDRLLKGYALIKESVPARIIILGGDESNNEYKSSLESLAGELGIGNRVNFTGSIPQADLPRYYSAADITIVPSYYESFCLVILESLACGTPVITSDIGAAKQIINNPQIGVVLDHNTPEAIAASIMTYIGTERRTEQGPARKAIAEYDWSRICRQLLGEYGCLIDKMQLCKASA
jgi:D-inositol-3-phosphate glycosyltransferase